MTHAFHGRRSESPNDPKLSDCGGRRGSCMVGGKAAVEAATVTPGAVRCSAWLGARLDLVKAWEKNLETPELAGDDRTTGDGKLELSERMELRKTKRLAMSRRVANRKPNRGHVCVVVEPRGSDAELGTEAEAEAWKIANARNWEQTFWRIVLKVDVRVRLTTPSSATAEHGAAPARWVERRRWKQVP